MAPSQDKWIRRFVITETNRHKKGFTIYKVTSLVFLKNAPEIVSKISVWKRYNDFKKLHKSLHVIYKNSSGKDPFPPFAKPKIFGRFEGEVVNERRECAIRLFKFIADHAILYSNEIFVKFFESSLLSDSTDCSHSISSDTSEDDHNLIHDHINSSDVSTISDVKAIDNFPSTSNILINTKNIYHNTDRTICNPNNIQSSECPKSSSGNVKLTLNIEPTSCEQSQNTISIPNDSELAKSLESNARYVLVAAAHMSAGYKHEAIGEYEEAYVQYKLGIAHLRHGVEFDSDQLRQIKILEKIKKYGDRADSLYNICSNRNVSILSKPVTELENYKVLRVLGSVMLTIDIREDVERVIQTVEKRGGDKDDISHYVLQRRVPFMVYLHAFIETETTVFLILDYLKGGNLWNHLKSQYEIVDKLKKNYERSASCSDVFQIVSPNVTKGMYRQLDESSRMLIDGFKTNSFCNRELPINKLLENSQKLLKSVDDTLKKSNSVASKLNEFSSLLYEPHETTIFSNAVDEETIHDSKLEELSLSPDSSENLSFESLDISRISPDAYNAPAQLKIKESQSQCTALGTSSLEATSNDSGIEIELKYWKVPEDIIKRWAAQLISALEVLHQQNVVVSTLRPDNILMNASNDIALSYIVPRPNNELHNFQMPYTAPELCMYLPPIYTDPTADIWSFGVILYELLTGTPFGTRHYGLFNSHSTISIPPGPSDNAKSLLLNVLKFEPSERLTISEIKKHPFFESIDWITL